VSKVIISKLGADTAYQTFGDSPHRVLVAGSDKLAVRRDGVRTTVSDEDAAFLAQHGQFRDHQRLGFMRIEDVAVA